jgi:CheY-like chemotaxis protein
MELEDLKIMLVEDNPEDAAFAARILKFNRLEKDLVLALDGREAIQLLQEQAEENRLPDLILLDINLPDSSGLDLLEKIKQEPRYSRIPVVILTGSNMDDDIQRSYDRGASTYLVKPISNHSLMLVIRNLFTELVRV